MSWSGESSIASNQYIDGVRDNYKIHFCESQYIPIYNLLGFNNLSAKIPKFYILNQLDRNTACSILNLDPNKKYVTFIITTGLSAVPGHPMSRKGVAEHLYTENNFKILDSIQQYCSENNIVTIQKNKLKYGTENCGVKTDMFLGGDNMFYHQTLLLMSISEFSVGFASSAVLEAESMNCNYINFCPSKLKSIDESREDFVNPNQPPYSLHCLLAREKSTFNIYTSSKIQSIENELFEFINNSSPDNFQTKHPEHEIFK